MSIDIYTGVPGSGKSLHAAADIRETLNRRRDVPVLANFALGKDAPVAKRELFTYIPNEDMSAKRMQDFALDWWSTHDFREGGLQLYLDECQLLFNSRNWSQAGRMAYLEFLSQSRKYGYHIVMIAQSAKMVDNQFRMLVDVEHNHRRVRSMGPFGAAVSLLFGGKLFMCVRYLFQSHERLGMSMRTYHRKDGLMYDSFAKFEQTTN